MTDLHNRFRALDGLQTPDLWREIEGRAAAASQRGIRSLPWALVILTLLLALAVGGAALIGSGVLRLPVSVDASSSPSASLPQVGTASWTGTGGLLDPRDHHTATLLLDGTVLVMGGDSDIGYPVLGSAERYDPRARAWSTTAELGVRTHHTATLLQDGRVLVAGGQSAHTVEAEAIALLYDPRTEIWAESGQLRQARTDHTATLLPDGRVLVLGGYAGIDGSGELISAELYDPAVGTWATTAQMAASRAGHTATLLLDGRVLVAGGYGGAGEPAELVSSELYDPATGTWVATSNLVFARADHTATRLPDGRVLVVGGSGTGEGLAFAELFDPATGSWSSARQMTTQDRYSHTATLLQDGRVLVVGGIGLGPLASAELFDPRTGMWTATAELMEGRGYHSATLLADGTVLVVGGAGGDQGSLLGSSEVYDPGTGS